MRRRPRNSLALLCLCLWGGSSVSCDPRSKDEDAAREESSEWREGIDPGDPVWSAKPEVFDDFDRADGDALGVTSVGRYAWSSIEGRPTPRLLSHALTPRGNEQTVSSTALDGFEAEDFLLSLDVRVTRPEARWSVSYRSSEDSGYRIEGSNYSIGIYRGDHRIGHADLNLRAGEWSRLQLIVEGSLHRVVVAGLDVMELDDPEGPSAGGFELGGNDGVELDDLWILGRSSDADLPDDLAGSPTAGASRAFVNRLIGRKDGDSPPGDSASSLPLLQVAPGGKIVPGGGLGVGGPGGSSDDPLRTAAAPQLDLTVPTTLYKQVRFLFDGPAPEQQGADLGVLLPARISLVHGWVRDAWGQPLAGVDVWVLGHPELGATTTRADGSYDIVVTGGTAHSVVLSHPSYLTVHRRVVAVAGESHRADDAVLLNVDPESSPISFVDPIELHHAFTLNDGAPDRMTTVMFRQGTQATMVFGDGTTAPLPEMTVRLTEYTVGDEGPVRMPSPLPSGTAYNYAIEISADEAEAAGAVSVELDTPAVLYVDNFLSWPVGAVVPSGSFDRRDGRWKSEPDGRVIEIVGINSVGLARIDVTGDGVDATATELLELGFSDDEREELASIYGVGAQLWRTPIAHFTPFDLNPSQGNGGEPPPDGLAPDEDGEDPDGCEGQGSIIGLDNQDLGERMPIAGTPFSLEYRSSRTRGAPNRGLRMKLTGDEIPDDMVAASAVVVVAGRTLVSSTAPVQNAYVDVQWDGLDAFGRSVQGPQPIDLCVGWDFPDPPTAIASSPNGGGGGGGGSTSASFGKYPEGAYIVHLPGREAVITYLKCYGNQKAVAAAAMGSITSADKYRLGGLDAQTISDRLGGWTIDVHHTLARATSTLYLGDGGERELADEALWTATRFAGNRATQQGLLEGPATGAFFQQPSAIAADPSGNVYVATPGLIRRIGPDGNAVIIAGTPSEVIPGVYSVVSPAVIGFAGDGGPATDAQLSNTITALVSDGEGGIYVADAGNARVRYIDPSGIIDTVAGSGVSDPAQVYAGVTPTGGDPMQVSLFGLTDLALTPDEDGLLIAQGFGGGGMVRLLTLDGELIHIAGDLAPSYIDQAAARPSQDCPPGGTCSSALGVIRSEAPWDTIPGLEDYLEPHEHRAEWALFGDIRGITAHGGSIYIGEDDRIRRVDGLRGGNIYGFRKRYTVSEPLNCGFTSCSYPTESGLDEGHLVGDLVGDHNGILYTTLSQELILAQDDLDTPLEIIIGGPDADTLMDGDDDVILGSRLLMTAYTELVRAPDGAIYIADRSRNLVYRVAKTVPPMYLTSWVSSEDGSEMFLFDDEGRHLETRDSRTHQLVWSFQYDAEGFLTGIVDRFGDMTTIHRDGSGDATSIESPDGQVTALDYDGNGFLSSITDPTGAWTDLVYSPTGLLTTMSDSDSSSTFDYDVRGRLTNDDATVSYLGMVEGTIPQVLERTQSTATLIEVTHTSGENVVTSYQRERTGPSSVDRVVTWPDNTQNTAQRSPHTESVTHPDGTTLTTRYETDLRLGLNTRVPASFEVAISGGPTVLTTFDRSYEPHCTSFTEDCDPFADPELQADVIVDSLTSGGDTWTETYHRPHIEGGSPVPATITQTTPLGRETVAVLDSDGQMESIAVAGLAPLEFDYDVRGRVETITRTDGADTRSMTIAYDMEGFVASVTDTLGRTTSYLYDEAGRVEQQTFPDGRIVQLNYDEDGNLLSLAPPGQPFHVFTHDSVDRTRSYHPPVVPPVMAPQTEYAYNDDHQPVTMMPPDGQTVQVLYDPVSGKLGQVVTPTGNYVYTYDPATGQLDNVTDPDGGSLTYGYMGFLVTSEALAGTVSGDVSWTYDAQLRVETESVNGAHTVSFGYDDDGAPSTIGDLVVTTNPLNGDLTGTTLGGVTSTHAANGFGEPGHDTYVHGATTIYDLELLRDEVGRIRTKIEVRGPVTNLRCYEYDLAGRLTDVHDGADAFGCTGSTVEHYGYDDNGNRNEVINSAVNLTSLDISIDAQDRLHQYGSAVYTYTENGEVATRTEGGVLTTFGYDASGNLQDVDQAGIEIEYIYDARNRRVGKQVGGVLVQGFLYGDDLNPVAELDGTGAVVSRFVYGTRPNVPDYMIDVATGDRYRIIADQLGSVVAVVNVATGITAQEITYDSWGRVLSDSNPGFQPFGFAGGIYDQHTGWVLFGARDYRPEVGAWAAKDPLGFGGGDANLFAYVVNDPVNLIDPTGLAWYDVVSDGAAGFGDTISFGLTRHVRQALDIDDVVDVCSRAYTAGEYAAYVHGVLSGAAAMRGARIARAILRPGLPTQVRSSGAVHKLIDGGRTLVVSENHLNHIWKAFGQYGGNINLFQRRFWQHVLPHRHVYRLPSPPAYLNANWRKTFESAAHASKQTVWPWN